MVAKGDAISPGLQDQPRVFGGQTRALTGVFAIDHNKIQPPAGAQGGKEFGDGSAPGAAHHIA